MKHTTTLMQPHRWFGLALSLGFALTAPGPVAAQNTNVYIQSLSGNGVLTWTNHPQAISYKVQWAPTLAGPWNDSGVATEWSLVCEGGSLKFFVSGRPVASTPWNPTLGVWYHLAATRAAGTLRLFIDGSVRDTVNNTDDIGGNRVLAIGAADNPTLFLNGYLDEIRISKGVAVWTGNFTPPIAPYGN